MAETYTLDLFIDKKVAEGLMCVVCFEVPGCGQITDHRDCGGVFCFSCISKWLQRNSVCPKCKQPFGKLRLAKDGNRSLYNLAQTLQVHCPFNKDCKWIGDFIEVQKHLAEEKKKSEIVVCPYKLAGCERVGTKAVIEKHMAEAAQFHAERFLDYATRAQNEYAMLSSQHEAVKKELKDIKARMPLPPPMPVGLVGAGMMLNPAPTLDFFKPTPVVYFQIKIEGILEGQVIFELFASIAPKTVENFRMLCLGTAVGSGGKPLCYRGNTVHRVIPGFMFQGGDIINENGTSGESIYGTTFPDENFFMKHSKEGVLSMANAGPNTNGSQFFVTFRACPWLDGKHVAFGQVIKGMEVVREVEKYGTNSGATLKRISIVECGQIR